MSNFNRFSGDFAQFRIQSDRGLEPATEDDTAGIVYSEPLPGVDTTEGFERLQGMVDGWLGGVSGGEVNESTYSDFRSLIEIYGYSPKPIDDQYAKTVQEGIKGDPWTVLPNLQKEHIGYVLAAPDLTLFQKGDLLMRSANALSNGTLPADGGKVVQDVIRQHQKWHAKDLRKARPQDFTARLRLHIEKLDSLMLLAQEWTPAMTRRQFYRHAASVVTGEEVTSVFVGFGVMLSYLDQPGSKERELVERLKQPARQRYHKARGKFLLRAVDRADSKKDKDMARLQRSIGRYNNYLKNQLPTTLEDIIDSPQDH